MTQEELEKLKKDHDYCIIPVENIIGIEDIDPKQRFKMAINIRANADSGQFCQFVNSEYFKTWGGKYEDMFDIEIEDD